MQLIEYPKCSTCKKAKNWLEENRVEYKDRNIITNTPTKEELKHWITTYHIPIKKLFNTSGIKYRKLNLKEELDTMKEEEKLDLLASDGMLIKRPILVDDQRKMIKIGFKKTEWEEELRKDLK